MAVTYPNFARFISAIANITPRQPFPRRHEPTYQKYATHPNTSVRSACTLLSAMVQGTFDEVLFGKTAVA